MHFKSMMDTKYFYANDFCFMKYDDDEDGKLMLWYGWPTRGV